jgi:proteasome lid subunit RPN8/RPN11
MPTFINDFEPFLTHDIRNAIVEHMLEEAPNECCGSITSSNNGYVYNRHKNVHSNPAEHFKFSKSVSARISTSDTVAAYVHSHPAGMFEPSKHDMKVQVSVGKPSVIATSDPHTGVVSVFSFGDHLLEYPLDGRPWHYGVFDCLEAVRSEMFQRTGIVLPAAPRFNDWWLPGNDEIPDSDRNMYEDNFRRYGYVEFTPNLEDPASESHPQVGDLLLMQINSPTAINHAAVYMGDNLIYQHRALRQSGKTPLGYMLNVGTIRKWVRHSGKKV